MRERGKTKMSMTPWQNEKNSGITNYVLKIDKRIMLKKACNTSEGSRIPKSKWSMFDNEKFVGTERKLKSMI